jgi:hypothetical protein
MKNKNLKILFASMGLLLLTSVNIPQKTAKAACDQDLKNWFCHDDRFCMTNTDESNCKDS